MKTRDTTKSRLDYDFFVCYATVIYLKLKHQTSNMSVSQQAAMMLLPCDYAIAAPFMLV
jgi:hypothetical protein